VLVHLLDIGAWLIEGRDLLSDYESIRRELHRYRPELSHRHEILVLNKVDLVSDLSALEALEAKLADNGLRPIRLSGATGEGSGELVRSMLHSVEQATALEKMENSDDQPDRERLD
jgi:GTP-binding protein